MLGDTAVAVNPNDDRYTHLVGMNVVVPLVGRLIPIVADDYSDTREGLRRGKITPAHDFNDFEVGKRHNLRLISVLDQEGRLTLSENEDYLRGSARKRAVVRRRNARRRALRRAQGDRGEAGRARLPREDRAQHPHGAARRPLRRRHRAVPPPTSGTSTPGRWPPAIAAVRNGETTFVPKNWEKTYFDWMEETSRVHLAPAVVGPPDPGVSTCRTARCFVAETEEEAVGHALGYYVEQEVITPSRPRHGARPGVRDGFIPRTRTCSTPGSPRRCGRSRRSAGPTTPATSSATTRPTAGDRLRHHLLSGSPGC